MIGCGRGRNNFGKVRYMNATGERKCDIAGSRQGEQAGCL
jgi:hypothetical protein